MTAITTGQQVSFGAKVDPDKMGKVYQKLMEVAANEHKMGALGHCARMSAKYSNEIAQKLDKTV